MRIESVLGTCFGWHCPLMFGMFTDHSIKCSQIRFSIYKKISFTLLIRMPKIGGSLTILFSRYSKIIQVHYILTSILTLPNLRVFHIKFYSSYVNFRPIPRSIPNPIPIPIPTNSSQFEFQFQPIATNSNCNQFESILIPIPIPVNSNSNSNQFQSFPILIPTNSNQFQFQPIRVNSNSNSNSNQFQSIPISIPTISRDWK